MSAVTVIDFPEDVVTVPIMCLQCEEPACEKVCPVHAIAIKPDGLVYRDDDRCIVCKLCVQACPMGNIAYLESARKVFKCDLCGGDPQCAKWCSFGAIAFIDPADDRDRRKAIAESLKEVFKEEVA
jgi:Fe-S-cluster-containing hydrogenase component 2